MTAFDAEAFDVAVIGAGHAGIEAALASARLGAKTACFSINLDAVGNMPCNPAIGGTAKGHLVREIDALGGEMARAADAACIQYRMLNRGKGPAVHSLRAQADRIKYRAYMKHVLEQQENLFLMQDEVVAIEQKDGAVSAIVTAVGVRHAVKAVVVACCHRAAPPFVYRNSKMFIGPSLCKTVDNYVETLDNSTLSGQFRFT